MMRTHYESSIDVEVRIDVAYTCWQRSQDFPDFVDEIDEVTSVGPDLTHWRIRVANLDYEWTAEVTEWIPGRRIAWRSRSGVPNAGCVTFHRIGPERTRVMLQIDYEPEGLLAAAGDVLRVPQHCIDAALEGFKRHAEGDPFEWRPTPSATTLRARRARSAPRLPHWPDAPVERTGPCAGISGARQSRHRAAAPARRRSDRPGARRPSRRFRARRPSTAARRERCP